MPSITRELLRKRAEHNEGIISTLEEISLHQEELEDINEILGMTCRKLKILYLQNNIIGKMENLFHLKDLEYLNLALNNIKRIEGLQNCEFLKKLDLTLNFIDFDNLKLSIDHLRCCRNLSELFMMGNPSQANWGKKFEMYVIALLPQLKYLDGVEITRSMQISARQVLPELEVIALNCNKFFTIFLLLRQNWKYWREIVLRKVKVMGKKEMMI
jgi:protein TilB